MKYIQILVITFFSLNGLSEENILPPPPLSSVFLGVSKTLEQGQKIISGRFQLIMQKDGDLALYHMGSKNPIWSSHTASKGARAIMQSDGNFVIYDAHNKAVWASHTGHRGSVLKLESNGNLVIYDLLRSRVLRNINIPAHTEVSKNEVSFLEMKAGTVLSSGKTVFSENGLFELIMQADGNLVLHKTIIPNKSCLHSSCSVVWSTRTHYPGSFMILQQDGNLVIVSGHHKKAAALWSTFTQHHPGSVLRFENTGILEIIDPMNSQIAWSSAGYRDEL